MYPLLRDGDLVVVKEVSPVHLKKGNLLVFSVGITEYIIHRLIKKEKKDFVHVRGDGYHLPNELVKKDAIIGKAVGIIRAGKFIPLNRLRELSFFIISLLKGYLKDIIRSKKQKARDFINRSR